MNMVSTSIKHSSQWHTTLKLIALLCLILFHCNALACIGTTDSFQVPPSIIILFICLAFMLSIMLVTYMVKRLFFEATSIYFPVVVSALLVAFIIGGFSSFLIPEYQRMYYEIGVALPIQTKFIIEYRFLLWIPFIAAIAVLILKNGRQVQISWLIAFLCSELVISMVVIWALYSAIFILGGC